MSLEPPPFQEAARCDVCKCSFNTFRRRHHCRCCGRTLCHEHSSNQMALPQFGVHLCVRVCSDCFNDSSRFNHCQVNQLSHQSPISLWILKEVTFPRMLGMLLMTLTFPLLFGRSGTSDGVNIVTDKVSRLDISADVDLKTKPTPEHHSVLGISQCKCGMPLCICEAPAPSSDAVPLQRNTTSTFTTQLNPKPKKTDTIPKNRGSASNSKLCTVFNLGQVTNSSLDKSQMDYEVNGEGLREAIKNSDTAAVKKLLSEGVDANYRDKQGLSLLHLAALFNQTDIVFALMEYGASLDCKNSQGNPLPN